MNNNRERWLQLALVAVCAALEEVECTDEALTESLFAGMPGIKIDDLTAVAVAGAASLRYTQGSGGDAGPLTRLHLRIAQAPSPGLAHRRLGCLWGGATPPKTAGRLVLSELGRRINLSASTIRDIEKARGTLRPAELTLAKLTAALGLPWPSGARTTDPVSRDEGEGKSPK